MEISTSLVGLEPTISRLHTEFHYSSCLRSSKQGISNIFLYIRVSKQTNFIRKWQKNMNWICPMTAIWNFTICGETVPFTDWDTAEMDSAQNFRTKTMNDVLFLKNAYGSLSRAIFQFLVLTNMYYPAMKDTLPLTHLNTCILFCYPGPRLNIKTVFPRYGDSMSKIRRTVRPSIL